MVDMEFTVTSSVFLGLGTLTAGAFLSALGSRLVVSSQTQWKWAFYILSIVSVVFGIIYLFSFPITTKPLTDFKFVDYFIVSLLLIFGALLFLFTPRKLEKKIIFETPELNSIINEFTENSDKSEIKLFGGDLNFFGNDPSDMDSNIQYTHLKSLGFRKVSILCEDPKNVSTKIRYGKILNDIREAELRFYNPDEADLHIRGRLKTLQGAEKLMVYLKISSGKYKTIETDTAKSDGALYSNIWKLVWSLADTPDDSSQQKYVELFRNG